MQKCVLKIKTHSCVHTFHWIFFAVSEQLASSLHYSTSLNLPWRFNTRRSSQRNAALYHTYIGTSIVCSMRKGCLLLFGYCTKAHTGTAPCVLSSHSLTPTPTAAYCWVPYYFLSSSEKSSKKGRGSCREKAAVLHLRYNAFLPLAPATSQYIEGVWAISVHRV